MKSRCVENNCPLNIESCSVCVCVRHRWLTLPSLLMALSFVAPTFERLP